MERQYLLILVFVFFVFVFIVLILVLIFFILVLIFFLLKFIGFFLQFISFFFCFLFLFFDLFQINDFSIIIKIKKNISVSNNFFTIRCRLVRLARFLHPQGRQPRRDQPDCPWGTPRFQITLRQLVILITGLFELALNPARDW